MNEKLTIFSAAAVLFLCGCSTVVNSHSQKENMMTRYLAGDYAGAAVLAEGKWESASGTGDELVWCLEAGSIHFVNGDYTRAIEQLNRASALVEDYDTRAAVSLRDTAAEGAVMLTNLNARSYRGFARDRIMIPVFRALAYLGCGDEEGFRTELFVLREAQNVVMEDYQEFFDGEEAEFAAARNSSPAAGETDKYRAQFTSSQTALGKNMAIVHETAHRGYGNFLNPLGIFLSGFGYMQDGDFENAHVDFHRLYQAMPDSPLAQRYYATALRLTKRDVPDELKEIETLSGGDFRNTVLVICASGRGPALEQEIINFPIFTAWSLVSFYPGGRTFPSVSADGGSVAVETVSDMDGIFAQEYDELLPGIITRIIMSTLIKDAAVIAASAAAYQADPLAGAAAGIVGTAYLYAVNTADTRSWEALPKIYGIAHFPMPADRQVIINGTPVSLPEESRSAVIYVNNPNAGVLSCNILPFYQK